MKATIAPEMLVWARERAGLSVDFLSESFKKLPEWENGDDSPTFKQLDQFAAKVHVPVGVLFLPEPPHESLPVPDFRTVANEFLDRPSTELIDTLHICQQRQNWYRDYGVLHQLDAIEFVGSLSTRIPVKEAANAIRSVLNYASDVRLCSSTFEDALRAFISVVEDAGVMVMVNGVVKHNTHRPLNPEEFRGFALVDAMAPLIFINGKDSKAAQMFTLAHEVAHVFLGETGVSDASAHLLGTHKEQEIWCNAVAGELLVPATELAASVQGAPDDKPIADFIATTFKVSRLVALRRLLDEGYITRETFSKLWAEFQAQWKKQRSGSESGGNFHKTAAVRNSKRFTSAVIRNTLAGRTLYRDAFHLLGLKPDGFRKQAKEMKITA